MLGLPEGEPIEPPQNKNPARLGKEMKGVSLTILEVLLNAQINFGNAQTIMPLLKQNPLFLLAKQQLDNSLLLLSAGASLDSVFEKAKLLPLKPGRNEKT